MIMYEKIPVESALDFGWYFCVNTLIFLFVVGLLFCSGNLF
jgi:hypothetical protein